MSGSAKLLIVGVVVMLALGLALLRSLGGEPGRLASTPRPPTGVAPAGVAPAATPAAPGRLAVAHAETPTVEESDTAPERPAHTRHALAPIDEPVANGPNGPVVRLAVVRDANAETHEATRECARTHNFTGSGKAVLNFTVAKQRDRGGERIVVTDSGVEADGTTITDQALLECLHKTAFLMKFPVTASGGAIWAKRRVVLEGTTVKDNWVFDFGHVR